ncbi:hypothetical protein RHOSPDRAFT_32462 [Rhodotorula sp. JG-1b]|nr:hypothetical protein RHOSPDRAFT_32462 [Rhodotorula sp. JG-1b]
MAAIEDDFAAYTTIGERVAVPAELRKPVQSRTAGPSFALDPHLEPFILLSKSARGAAAAGLVEKATAAPAVYVFAELLQQPSINDLANQEQHVKSYRLLQLFAYGTWADYNDHRDQYPNLSREQETKLKHLTILSLAAQSRTLPYSTLLSTLSLDSVPQLEDILIELFYANVLAGRLDQKHERLEIISARGRDVRHVPVPVPVPVAVAGDGGETNEMQVDQGNAAAAAAAATPTPTTASLHTIISSWQTTLLNLIRSLESHLAAIHADQVNSAHYKLQHEEYVKAVVGEAVPAAAGGGGGKGGKGKAQSAGGGGGGGGSWNAASGFGGQGAGAAGGGGGGDGVQGTAAGTDADETARMMDLDDDENDAATAAMSGGSGGGGGGGGGGAASAQSPSKGGGGGGGGGSGSMGRTRKRGRI